MKANRRLLAAIVVPLFLLAGCGEAAPEGAASPPAQAGDSDPTANVREDPELAAKLPEKYRSKPLVIGNTGESPPLRIDAGGKRTGAEADLVQAAATLLGAEVTFTKIGFDGLIPAINAKRADLIASAMADYADRQKQIDFVDYFELGITMIVQKGNPQGIETIDDLCGQNVAIERGTGAATAVQRQSEICTKAGKPAVNLSLFPDDNDALLQLMTGRAAVITNDLPAAVHMVQTSGGGTKLELVDRPLYGGIFYGFGFRKEDAALRDAWQAAVQKLLDDGVYDAILKKYGIEEGALEKITINAGKERPFK